MTNGTVQEQLTEKTQNTVKFYQLVRDVLQKWAMLKMGKT
jgi:hypothetical protein